MAVIVVFMTRIVLARSSALQSQKLNSRPLLIYSLIGLIQTHIRGLPLENREK